MAMRHAMNRHFRLWQPDVDQVETIAVLLQLGDPRRERAACERGFEGEVFTLGGKLMKVLQHDPAGLDRQGLGRERGQAACDRVGVHEMAQAHLVAEE